MNQQLKIIQKKHEKQQHLTQGTVGGIIPLTHSIKSAIFQVKS